jgi:hypothetical protein
LIHSQHHITLDHKISIKIEREVDQFIENLYSD